MSRFEIRPVTSDDFAALSSMERDVFGAAGEEVLCPHYLRLCTEVFAASCFVAYASSGSAGARSNAERCGGEIDGDRPAGYLLSFEREREAWCTTLAVVPAYQKSRVAVLLIGAFVRRVIDRVDTCWFTVKEDNAPARAVHRMLGAVEVDRKRDYYGPGDERLLARIDRATFERMRPRYERLGLVPARIIHQGTVAGSATVVEAA